MKKRYLGLLATLVIPFALSIVGCNEPPNPDNANEEGIKNDDKEKPLWDIKTFQYGEDFRDTLAECIKDKVTMTTTYSNCLGVGRAAASVGGGKFVPFYHGSDYAVSGSVQCNREHTWPNSRGGGSKMGGDLIERDPFMVRPTITEDNSDRENYFYGLGTNREWDPASCGFEGARGESARVIFYVATKYGRSHGLSLSNNPSDPTSAKTMGTLKYLYEWNKYYPVTAIEKQINDYLDSQGYGRNPFVDHPEYVDYIWDENGIRSTPIFNVKPYTYTYEYANEKGNSGNQTYSYSLIDAINDIDKASAYIVSSNDGLDYYAMTDANTGPNYPWYFTGEKATLKSDFTGCNVGASAKKFNFSKLENGNYTIKYGEKYLYSYIDGSHYSIGMLEDIAGIANSSKEWSITASGKGYDLKGVTTEVYLQYYKSFSGNKTAPQNHIYLYK